MNAKIAYYTFQCDRCFIISGHASKSADDTSTCCGGEPMTAIAHYHKSKTTASELKAIEGKEQNYDAA